MTQDARPARIRTLRSDGLIMLAALGVVGCATLGGDPGQSLVPDRVVTRAGPFAVYTNAPIPRNAPVVENLGELERDLTANLGLRVAADGPPVEVYILKDREAFTHFLTFYYPELPPRRAFFLAQGPRRFVYTFYNDRLDEDLRHEATHALLHSAVGDLPLWLDEGLAEYFEGPGGRQGRNPEHLAKLPNDLKGGWRPDLARLETLKSVREMTPRDYRESWSWVHYLLNGSGPGKASLLAYLADLRTEPNAPPLSERLARSDRDGARQMLAHLERTRTAPVAAAPANGKGTVLFQDAILDPLPRGSPRRTLLGRFLSLVGLPGRTSNGEVIEGR